MKEITTKKIKKSLCFENSGENISVCICLKNVSPQIDEKPTILDALDVLFKEAKDAIH